MKKLQPIKRGSFSEEIYDQLRAGLMNGFYEPGERLLIAQIAAEMGTSVTPVREAIFRLAADGMLEIQKAHSVVVPRLTTRQIAELKTIRALLEGESAAVAATLATPEQIAEITRINDAFFACMRGGDPRQASEYNREFHLAVVAIAEMPILLATVETMWARMGPMIYRNNLDLLTRRDYGPDHDHYRVIDGLQRHNSALARVAIQNDIRSSRMTGYDAPAEEAPPGSPARRSRRKATGG
jgi:DNA-binding GntR family transcriptional regulator